MGGSQFYRKMSLYNVFINGFSWRSREHSPREWFVYGEKRCIFCFALYYIWIFSITKSHLSIPEIELERPIHSHIAIHKQRCLQMQ